MVHGGRYGSISRGWGGTGSGKPCEGERKRRSEGREHRWGDGGIGWLDKGEKVKKSARWEHSAHGSVRGFESQNFLNGIPLKIVYARGCFPYARVLIKRS